MLVVLGIFQCFALVNSRSPWPDAPRARARALIPQLTLEEKVSILSGLNANYGKPGAVSPYVGFTPGVPRLNIPPLTWEDGPQGVADGLQGVTAFPSQMTVAQTWQPELFYQWGVAMGLEQRGKGSSIMLGPSVSLVRCPWTGRAFEYFSEDPVLNSAFAAAIVAGIQSTNISACAKHFLFNSQEVNRGDVRGSPGMSSNVAERVGRELYAPPYVAAVDAGVGTVMCAFVRVNNTYACENEALLKEWLYTDMGFDGTVVSDWTATHSTVASILAGLSVEQEWLLNASFYGVNLTQAVLTGKVPVSAVDDAALRVLTTIYATTDLGDTPNPPSRNVSSSVNSTAHASLARRLAVAGTVLLKNTGGLLPLDPSTLCRVVVVGDPEDTVAGGGSGGVVPPYVVSPMQGLQAALPRTTLIYLDGSNATAAGEAAANADVAIVIVGQRTSEGMDRVGLALPPGQDDMVRAVAAGQPKTVVIARCSGACLMPWVGDVPSIVNALYGGQEAGAALADILLGAATPAGKLTVSFPKSNNDTWLSPPGGGPVIPSSYPGVDRGRGYPEVDYSEGLHVGYRWFDSQGTDPLFPFGHGASYTTFSYGNLSVVRSSSDSTTVSFSVTNNGTDYPGGEVAQVYVAGAFPSDPPKQLKGFKYTGILPVGYQVNVDIVLEPLVYWSVEEHAFVSFPKGDYTVWVGGSSRDLRLQGVVRV